MELLERKSFDVDEGMIDVIHAVTPERHPCRCHSFNFIPEPIAVTVVKGEQNGVAERPLRVQITLELGNSDGAQTFVAQVLQFARKLDRRDR
jgi:hypothetical protein